MYFYHITLYMVKKFSWTFARAGPPSFQGGHSKDICLWIELSLKGSCSCFGRSWWLTWRCQCWEMKQVGTPTQGPSLVIPLLS